jgi:hypothetical protein
MDQTIVEVTDGPAVRPGDPVVLLGDQGSERITAQEWAERLDTIPYEVICGFSVRLPREVCRSVVTDASGAGVPAAAPETSLDGDASMSGSTSADDPAPTDEIPVMAPR